MIAPRPNFPQRLYLSLWVAEDYPWQEPGYQSIKWRHMALLAVPVVGLALFMLVGQGSDPDWHLADTHGTEPT